MKARRLLILCVVALLGSLTMLHAADITGKWTATQEGRNGPQTITMEFKQAGTALTGSVTGGGGGGGGTPMQSEMKEGKVEGDTVTFSVTRMGRNGEQTTKWTGKIAGDEISFSREGGGGGKGGGRGNTPLVAKRAK